MSRTRSRPRHRATGLAVLALLTSLTSLAGCSAIDGLAGGDEPSAAPATSPSATETPYDSQFTRDGTFQSHIDVDGLDFVYTLYPTKSTPRTNEWYPKGRKHFSFTFQAYDLDRDLRDPFRTKRKVYLDRIEVTSQVVTDDGPRADEEPYFLDAEARRITFDPEPTATERGMLVTSPKGSFELRNQVIRPTTIDTRGIDLFFTATVWMERRAGSGDFVRKQIRQKVPIAIFESDRPTQSQSIPVDAN